MHLFLHMQIVGFRLRQLIFVSLKNIVYYENICLVGWLYLKRRPDMTLAVVWDIKDQFKQTNRNRPLFLRPY